MTTLLFDTETNGLLDTMDRVHCVVIRDVETNQVSRWNDQGGSRALKRAYEKLEKADTIVAHNAVAFDVKAIQIVEPDFQPPEVIDSLIMARLIWPDIKDRDFRHIKRAPDFPKKLIGRHSLESWGHRLKLLKGDYASERKALFIDSQGSRQESPNKDRWDADLSYYTWGEWSMGLEDYCEQDINVLSELWSMICQRGYDPRAVDIEHRFQDLILKQEAHGWPFDVKKAQQLVTDLTARHTELEDKLQDIFPPEIKSMKMTWWLTPDSKKWETKKSAVDAGHPPKTVERGDPRTKEIPFNPASRDHIARRLIEKYDWKPQQFTTEGKPQVDETVLSALKYPEAIVLQEYLMVDKRLGAVANGREAWLKHERNGRIHGRVNTVGTITRRCTHSKPNMTQPPTINAPWGRRCRELFTVEEGYVLVGADASGIELRCLGHYLFKYDGGKFAKAVIEGTQADGTDVHSLNAKALGFDPVKKYIVSGKQDSGRQIAKVFIYAWLYGAGIRKIASLLGVPVAKAKKIMARYLKAMPAIARLREDIDAVVAKRGWLKAIDGGRLQVRHAHAALNTLLQSAGGITMKLAAVILYEDLIERGFEWGKDFAQLAHIHDELQLMVKKEHANVVGKRAVAAIKRAGKELGFLVALDGDFKVGQTWADTH